MTTPETSDVSNRVVLAALRELQDAGVELRQELRLLTGPLREIAAVRSTAEAAAEKARESSRKADAFARRLIAVALALTVLGVACIVGAATFVYRVNQSSCRQNVATAADAQRLYSSLLSDPDIQQSPGETRIVQALQQSALARSQVKC